MFGKDTLLASLNTIMERLFDDILSLKEIFPAFATFLNHLRSKRSESGETGYRRTGSAAAQA